jgi:hypothetical protein
MKKNCTTVVLKAAVIVTITLVLLLPGTTAFANHKQPTPVSSAQNVEGTKSDWLMRVENTSGDVGETGHVIYITGSWIDTLAGYCIALYYDETKITIADVSLIDTIADYLYTNWSLYWWYNDSVSPNYLLATAVTFGYDLIPAGSGNLFKLIVNISETAPLGDTVLDLEHDVGPTSIDCLYALHDASTIRADIVDGSVTIEPVICGDVNGDGVVGAGDVVYLLSYLFRDGPPPSPLCEGDANGDGSVGAGDVVYLISYLFRNGPPPVSDCCPFV